MWTRGVGAVPALRAGAVRVALGCALVLGCAVVLWCVAGCVRPVAGQGRPAASGTTGPAASGAPDGSRVAPGPGLPGLPGLPQPPGGGANPDPEVPDSPCDVLDRADLTQRFGPDADIVTELDGCKVTAADGSFLSFNSYPALTLNDERHRESGRSAMIAGLPAYLAQRDHYIVVGRSQNPDNRGIVTCYVGFAGSSQINGIQLATRLLAELMPHYSY